MNDAHPIVEERLTRVQTWMREKGYSSSSMMTVVSQLRFLLRGWTDLEDPGTVITNFTAAPFSRQASLLSAWRTMEKACAPPNDLYLPTIPEFEARSAVGRPRLDAGHKEAGTAKIKSPAPEPAAELVSALGKNKSDLLRAAWALHDSLPFLKQEKRIPIGALGRLTWNMIRDSSPWEKTQAAKWIEFSKGRAGLKPLGKTLVFYVDEAGAAIESVVLTDAWMPIFQILAGWCGTDAVNKGSGAVMFPSLPDTAGPALKAAELRKAIAAPELAIENATKGQRTLVVGGHWQSEAPELDPETEAEKADMKKTVGALSRLNISATVFAPVTTFPAPPPRPPAPAGALGPTPSTIIQPASDPGRSAEDT